MSWLAHSFAAALTFYASFGDYDGDDNEQVEKMNNL